MDPPLLPLGPPPAPEVVALLKKRFGSVPEFALRLSHCPWMLADYVLEDEYAFIPYELADLVVLVVSQDNSCRHCYGASRAFLRMMGFTEERIERIEEDVHRVDLDPRTRLALDYARRMSRANPRPGRREEEALLDAGFSREAIAELALHAANSVFGNRLMTLCAMEPTTFETMPDRWYAGLLRPIFQWSVRRERKRAPPRCFRPGENVGLAAQLLAALDGVPAAPRLRRFIDETFASPALPSRSKHLIFAVVARTLGCRALEAEASEALQSQGLEASDVADILDNLASPMLTALETRLVPLARETVRYLKPMPVQQRMRELSAHLSPAELLEMSVTFALANALGRLTVLLDRCQ
jgi:AhpD family alkylhydroperoxidase